MSRGAPKGSGARIVSRGVPIEPERRQPGARMRAPHGQWFSALGDRTRLALIARLSRGECCSIAQLTAGSRLTRQAITKHLRVLERAQLVRSLRSGRESLFQLDPTPMHAMRAYLDQVSLQWDLALARRRSPGEDRRSADDQSRRGRSKT